MSAWAEIAEIKGASHVEHAATHLAEKNGLNDLPCYDGWRRDCRS